MLSHSCTQQDSTAPTSRTQHAPGLRQHGGAAGCLYGILYCSHEFVPPQLSPQLTADSAAGKASAQRCLFGGVCWEGLPAAPTWSMHCSCLVYLYYCVKATITDKRHLLLPPSNPLYLYRDLWCPPGQCAAWPAVCRVQCASPQPWHHQPHGSAAAAAAGHLEKLVAATKLVNT